MAQSESTRRAVRSRGGAEQVVRRVLKPYGFEPVVSGDEDEPVVSIRVGRDRWVDVYVREVDGNGTARYG